MSQHPTNIGGADIASPTCDDHMAGQAERERREMTQNTEQKVRTREEQIEDLYIFIDDESHSECRRIACEHIQEAEARGAAEQRRKDADRWAATHLLSASKVIEDKNANVAALEARVKELETEVSDKGLAAVHLLAVLHRPDLTKIQKIEAAKRQLDAHLITGNLRAALTREEESRQTAAMEARAEAEIEKWS